MTSRDRSAARTPELKPRPDTSPQPHGCTRQPAGALLSYALPSAGIGFMSILISTYLLKFSTDVRGSTPFTLDVDLVLPGTGLSAVFGHSGSGKTTLVNLMLKFHAPQSGSIFLDGHDLLLPGLLS